LSVSIGLPHEGEACYCRAISFMIIKENAEDNLT